MNIRRYMELIARIGYTGAPLKKLETELSQEWGVSVKTIWYYINQLKKEGLVRYRRDWRRGPIWIVPTPELKEMIAEIEKNWAPEWMKRYVK